jgi:hypothetical protein
LGWPESHAKQSGAGVATNQCDPKVFGSPFFCIMRIATKGGIHFYNQTARSAMFDHPNFVPNSSPLIQFDSLMNLSWPFIIIYHPNPD